MSEITRKIELGFDSTNPFKIIYNESLFWMLQLIPFIIINLILFAIAFCKTPYIHSNEYLLWILSSFIFSTLFFLFIINPYAKKQLKKLSVVTDDSFFKLWNNDAYYIYIRNRFNKTLIENKVLSKNNSLQNIDSLKELSYRFTNDSSQFSSSKFLTFFTPLLILFISTFLETFSVHLLQSVFETYNYDLIYPSIILLSCLFIACILVSFLFMIIIQVILEWKQNKYLQISDALLDLKWQEQLNLNK